MTLNPHRLYIAEKFSDARSFLLLPRDDAKAIEAAFLEISLVLSPPYLRDNDPDIDCDVADMISELKKIMYPRIPQSQRCAVDSDVGWFGNVARRMRHPKKERLAELVNNLANHFSRECR
jgi:hypothetical protein